MPGKQTAEDTVLACPSCDESAIRQRVMEKPKWRCTRCGDVFDEPREREKKAGVVDPQWPPHNLGVDLKAISNE